MIFDYLTLKLIWWAFLGVLLIGFAIMDGHDMGVGTLLLFVGKTDLERRAMIHTIAPHWDGNQVWFITAGGAIFAALPIVYATAFSGFYWAMLAVLWALFFRPVGFDYRSKVNHAKWRQFWDISLCLGSALPPFLFGIAFGNLFLGVPFSFDWMQRIHYTGGFFDLLTPFTLLVGIVSSSLFTAHGANYLMLRTEKSIYIRAKKAAFISYIVFLFSFLLAGYLLTHMEGYISLSEKLVGRQVGGWFHHFERNPLLWLFPILANMSALLGCFFVWHNHPGKAFISSSVSFFCVTSTAGIALFPFFIPSSTHPNSSLSLYNSTSSHLTLQLMFWATLIFLPLILFYTSWAYRVMRGTITTQFIEKHQHQVY